VRRNNCWVFGHQGGLFAGNSKYLFLWISLHRPDIRAVWITTDQKTLVTIRNAGFEAHRRWSVQGIAVTLRAKVFVCCHGVSDINSRLSGGAFLVNLWHGVGIKATMFGDKGGIVYRSRNYADSIFGRMLFYDLLKLPDIVASTSDFMQQHFSEQFCLPLERCPQIGYPRLDPLLNLVLRNTAVEIDRRTGFQFNHSRFDNVIVYMPTWRDSGRSFLSDALPDLGRLSSALEKCNAVLYIKLHPWTKESLPTEFSNIIRWPDEIEVYTYLYRVNALITDYSSVLYDYIYGNGSGIVLYTFDIDDFKSKDRAILYSFEENTVGLRVSTFDALCDAIATGQVFGICEGADHLRERFWGKWEGAASPRVVECVERALGALTTEPRHENPARQLSLRSPPQPHDV
jgi:CDP-glycerol glycerophosphotransferase (TagB/SpsB family)